jgi:hypothetical protein
MEIISKVMGQKLHWEGRVELAKSVVDTINDLIEGVFGLAFGFAFFPLKANQRAGSRKQLFLKADFLAVQN